MSCSITSLEEILITSGETLNVSMSFESILDDGVTISDQSVSCTPTGVTIVSITVSGQVVYFSVSSTTPGRYIVEVEIDTSDLQTLVGKGNLRVIP